MTRVFEYSRASLDPLLSLIFMSLIVRPVPTCLDHSQEDPELSQNRTMLLLEPVLTK